MLPLQAQQTSASNFIKICSYFHKRSEATIERRCEHRERFITTLWFFLRLFRFLPIIFGFSHTLFPERFGTLNGIGFSWPRSSKIGCRRPLGQYSCWDTAHGAVSRCRFVPAATGTIFNMERGAARIRYRRNSSSWSGRSGEQAAWEINLC